MTSQASWRDDGPYTSSRKIILMLAVQVFVILVFVGSALKGVYWPIALMLAVELAVLASLVVYARGRPRAPGLSCRP